MVVHMLQVSALDKAPFGAMARDIVLFMDDKSTFRSCKRDGIFYEVSIPYSFGFAQMMSKRHAGFLNSELTFLPFAPATAAPAVRAASCEAWPWRFRKSLMSFKLRERPVPS
jgi:hypothetical protein